MNENPNWHEATADAVDNEWLEAIGTSWMRLTGKHWETRDGETREEGLSANVGALFQELDDARTELERVQKQAAKMRGEMEWATKEMRGRCPDHWMEALSSDAGKDYIPKPDVKPLVEAVDRIYRNALIADGVNIQHVDTIWLRQTCAKALQHAQAKGLL